MFTQNDFEKNMRKKFQEDTRIPVIVHERIDQAYRLIENDQLVQKKAVRDPYCWMRTGSRIAGGMAAVLAVGFMICAANPVMAKNIPLVGSIFDMLQDNVSFFGEFADKATMLENTEDAEEEPDSAYVRSEDGLTITCSEIYANSQAIYMTVQFQSDEPFPEIMTDQEGNPIMELVSLESFDFLPDSEPQMLTSNMEGRLLDENTYVSILRIDLAQAAKDYTEYNEKHDEMTQQVLDEMGVSMDDLDDETEEGYALLSEFVDTVSEREGALRSYIKDIEVPETFHMQVDIQRLRGMRADYDVIYDDENYDENETDSGYCVFTGDWEFDIPVTVDDSATEERILNETNDAGIGLRSVIRTPYELTVNELYEDGADSDNFLVALDANGNKLPYNESSGSCNNFTIQDRDISRVDIYILDYVQYMDELKGEDNYNNNENKPDEEKWSTLLDQYAKYHKTLYFE